MTRTSESASASSMATASSSRSSGVMVLYSSARVRTIDRTPSSVSVRNVVGMVGRTLTPAAGLVDGGVAGVHDGIGVVGDDGHVEGHELMALALGDLLDQRAGRDAVAVVHQRRETDRALHMDPRS